MSVSEMVAATLPDWLVSSTAKQEPLPADSYKSNADSRPVYIYALLDPETGECRYIGKSIRPAERLSNHVNEPPSNCHRSHWIQSLKSRGLRPDMVILERVEGNWPWQEAERFWIAYGRENGWPLTNNTDGGDGVPGLTESARARITATWLGRKHRPETIERLKMAWTRRSHTFSPEVRKHMSDVQLGRVISWGAKIGTALRKLTTEQVEQIQQRLANGALVKDLAAEYGVHRLTISRVKKGVYFVPFRNRKGAA